MTDLEALPQSGLYVLVNGGGGVDALFHIFEWKSKNVVAVCRSRWRAADPKDVDQGSPKIIFIKGKPERAIDGTYKIGEFTVRPIGDRDIDEGLTEVIRSYQIEMLKAPELFTREAAERYVWDIYEANE